VSRDSGFLHAGIICILASSVHSTESLSLRHAGIVSNNFAYLQAEEAGSLLHSASSGDGLGDGEVDGDAPGEVLGEGDGDGLGEGDGLGDGDGLEDGLLPLAGEVFGSAGGGVVVGLSDGFAPACALAYSVAAETSESRKALSVERVRAIVIVSALIPIVTRIAMMRITTWVRRLYQLETRSIELLNQPSIFSRALATSLSAASINDVKAFFA